LPGKEVIEMEIQVRRLRETLALLEPAVPKKASLPVCRYVRLGDGRAIATDLDVDVSIDLAGAEEPILLPLKGALDFLRFTPGHQAALIAVSDNKATITVGDMQTILESADPQDFPALPMDGGESDGVLNGDALVRALVSVAPYATSETGRPTLNGVHLATGDELEAVAADGYRLVWERIPGRLPGPPMVIPTRAVDLLAPLWKHAAAPAVGEAQDVAGLAMAKRLIRLDWGTERLRLRFGAVCMAIKLIQGTFPNYRQLIPSETTSSLTVFGEDLERAVRQVAGMAQKGSGIVRLSWEGERLLVSAKAEDVGETSVPVAAQCASPGRTALNLGYLRDYLKGKAGLITISLSGESGPALFAHRGTPHVVMMPMGVQWDGPTPAAVSEAEEVVEQAEAHAEVAQDASEEEPKRKRKRKEG